MKSKEEIEKVAEQYIKDNTGDHYVYCGFVDGYTQCQEDNKDKKYTEEDLRKAFKYGIEMEAGIESFDYKNYPDGFSQFIDSLNKQD